jgi:hypothetical protein
LAVGLLQRAIMGIMQTFKVACLEHAELRPAPGALDGRTGGFRAPGRIVLVVQEGTGWVPRQDGSRETVEAQSVVIFDTGDWFEYGWDGDGEFKVDAYWEADLSEEEWKATFAEAFGPDFIQQAWPGSE